jgi:hypothetical protein
MIIGRVREQLKGIPDDSNVARSVLGHAGVLTAGQVRAAIKSRPDNDYVRLSRSGENPEIGVCRLNELPKFFC